MADLVFLFFVAYAAIGLLFAVYFVTAGVSRIDPVAAGSPILFRLFILPGCAALWPILAAKLKRATRKGTQGNA